MTDFVGIVSSPHIPHCVSSISLDVAGEGHDVDSVGDVLNIEISISTTKSSNPRTPEEQQVSNSERS